MPLEPTWLLKTSEKSYQAGYKLGQPIEKVMLANEISNAIADAGFANLDQSGNNAVRYVRLPVGYNNKPEYGKTFQCALTQWNPEITYSVEQICEAIGITLSTNPHSPTQKNEKRKPESDYLALQDQIRAGVVYHQGLLRIAARRLANGMTERATVEELQALMNASSAERNDRWQERYDDIGRTVKSAVKFKPDPDDAAALTAIVEALSNGENDGWHVTPYGVEGLPDLSHDQLAIELGKAGFAKDARYVAQWSKWLFWSGSRWERDERLMHFTAVRDYLRAKATKLIEWGDKKAEAILAAVEGDAVNEAKALTQAKAVQAYARDNAKAMRQNPCVNAIESLAKSNAELVAVPSQFDADPMMLGTPKGTVDLATGNVRPAARADYLTRQCAVAPAARSTPCPTWMAFLHRAMNGDAQLIEFLQRVVGYTLTGQTTEHKLFFLFGTGRNGKSVFVNTIFGMMGDYAKRAPAQTFLDSHGERHPTDLAGLQGARFVAGSELPAGKAWNESIIKDLTGGDVITARFMRGDFFDYRPQFTLFIAGNHQPAIKTTDEAMRARIVLVPFTVTIPENERDPMLESKLRQEWAAILRWAIEGAVAWTQSGLQVPPSVRDASREYLDTEDHVGEFIDERLRTTSGNTLPSNELYRVFSDWQKNAGISPWSKKAMSQALTERGIKSEKLTGGTRGYRNLAVVPYATTDDYRYQSGR